jgi:hypothetical protein
MANFTLYLNDVIAQGHDIGLKNYPIWNEAYRETLNEKIVEHYRYQEIGLETPELFIHFLNLTMDEEMPYFNNLYSSIVGIEDAFKNVDVESAQKSESTGTSTGTGETTQYLYPQTRRLEDEDYAQSGGDSTQETKSDSMSGGVSKTEGLQGMTKSDAALRWRDQLFDIDMLVIHAVRHNFMEIYEFIDNTWL